MGGTATEKVWHVLITETGKRDSGQLHGRVMRQASYEQEGSTAVVDYNARLVDVIPRARDSLQRQGRRDRVGKAKADTRQRRADGRRHRVRGDADAGRRTAGDKTHTASGGPVARPPDVEEFDAFEGRIAQCGGDTREPRA